MSFDLKLWRDRALARHCKAPATRCAAATEQLDIDLLSIKNLATLVSWCESKRLKVEFKQHCSEFDDENSTITISCRLRPEAQLHVLLHECGHYLIGDPDPNGRFGMGHRANKDVDLRPTRTTVHRIDVVDEELEAWARGLKLVKRLRLGVDVDRYNRTRALYVRTYMVWAVKKVRGD